MRLIHYSSEPNTFKVVDCPHDENMCGAFKTPGLWVSVEGEYDWVHWCVAESFNLESLQYATEVILKENHKVLFINNVAQLDLFTRRFKDTTSPVGSILSRRGVIDWLKVREQYQGLIIAPYQWERRLASHTMWYYGWDCASGVIWAADAVAELRPIKDWVFRKETHEVNYD